MILKKIAKKYTPDLYCNRIYNIDFNNLLTLNKKGIIIDLDNTILPWKEINVPQDSIDWVKNAKDKGFKVFILSNTVKTQRLKKIAGCLDCEYIHPACKPNPRSYLKVAKRLGIAPQDMVVVGDQIFTDIYGGKRAGMFTILVDKLDEKEFFGTKISRFFEKKLKKHMDI